MKAHFVSDDSFLGCFYGARISGIAEATRTLLRDRKSRGYKAALSKREKAALIAHLQVLEAFHTRSGLNFSRTQVEAILRSRDNGELIEFETMGPYLCDYTAQNGVMTTQNLTDEDALGLRLAVTMRSIFPKARLVSLYDEYNTAHYNAARDEGMAEFTTELKHNFKRSLIELFKSAGVISEHAVEDEEFLFVPESQKVTDAEKLTARLENLGFIQRDGQEVLFVNELAENPLNQRIRLRTKAGKWLCEALDAAAFLHPQNANITHIVVLPEYMKGQQDRVWEILRVTGVRPERYHNIFFDPELSPEQACRAMTELFAAR